MCLEKYLRWHIEDLENYEKQLWALEDKGSAATTVRYVIEGVRQFIDNPKLARDL